MSYRRAEQILPEDIIELIQEYVDGECIYIPRRKEFRQEWGTQTGVRQELSDRNRSIFGDFLEGASVRALADKYYLSIKSIQRIVREMKKAA